MGLETVSDIDIPLDDDEQLQQISRQVGLTVQELQMARQMSEQVVASGNIAIETQSFELDAPKLREMISQAVSHRPTDISKILQRDYPTANFEVTTEDETIFKTNRKRIRWGPPALEIGHFITPFHLSTHLTDPEDYICKEVNTRVVDELGMEALNEQEHSLLTSVLFGTPYASQVNRIDVIKWMRHPIAFVNESVCSSVMMQLTGGPCGVLACLQAMIIQRLLYSGSGDVCSAMSPSPVSLGRAFSDALSIIIKQATPQGQNLKVVWIPPIGRAIRNKLWTPVDFGFASLAFSSTANSMHESDMAQWDDLTKAVKMMKREFGTVEELRLFIFKNMHLLFCAPRIPGILSIVASVAYSRGCRAILTEDFEGASDRALLSLFGHCSQELVNLLLVGRASANLFNGDRVLGGAEPTANEDSTSVFVLRGVPRRGLVGYLNQMEALRYCEVGEYLKDPFYPIWVLGSSDHFTVLWSLDISAVQMTETELLTHLARSIFHKLDEDETGLLKMSELIRLLNEAAFDKTAVERGVQEMSKGEVILRNDFIDFFMKFRDRSSLWTEMDATDKLRLLPKDEKPKKTFVLFHLDNQISIARGRDEPLVSSLPVLTCLKMCQLECGFDESQDRLSTVLSTRWPQPIQIRRVPSDKLKQVLTEIHTQTPSDSTHTT